MEVKETFQKGDRIKIKSMNGLKDGLGLTVGAEGVVVNPRYDLFDNGGFDLDGITPIDDALVKLDSDGFQILIPNENITKV